MVYLKGSVGSFGEADCRKGPKMLNCNFSDKDIQSVPFKFILVAPLALFRRNKAS